MKAETVKFKKSNGPVYLEVTSGHVTLGSFFLDYAKKGTFDFEEIDPDKKKKIADEERDYFRIPVPLDELKDYYIVLSGRYSPAPGHDQINVTYSFFQGGDRCDGAGGAHTAAKGAGVFAEALGH